MSDIRLLVINQYYAPDLASTGQFAADICEGLAARGYDVTVVTGEPSYEPDAPDAPRHEHRGGVEVHRVSTAPFSGKESLVSRFGKYSRFMLGAWRRATEVADELDPDAVLTFHNPPFVGLLGAHVKRRFDAAYVYSPYDILPDVVVRGGWLLPDSAVRTWERVNDHIHDHADEVVVLGRGMKQVLADEKGVEREKINSAALWAQPELSPAGDGDGVRQEFGIGEDELLLLYSGNMGYMHAVEPIMEAAAMLDGAPARFLMVGRGPKRSVVESALEEHELDNTELLPYQPMDTFEKLVGTADVAFVTLEPEMEKLAVPSRALTFLSAGTPLMVGMGTEGEIARLTAEADCGWIVRSARELKERVLHLIDGRDEIEEKSRNALEAYRTHFSREQTVETYDRIIRRGLASDAAADRAGRQEGRRSDRR